MRSFQNKSFSTIYLPQNFTNPGDFAKKFKKFYKNQTRRKSIPMKAKSVKLRTLIILHTLWKLGDEKHRIGSATFNEYLKPYGLECKTKALSDAMNEMREYGLDIRIQGGREQKGFCWANRPLQDDALDKIIFAVQTNPYLTHKQASDIMASLVPLVTTRQEEKLKRSFVYSDDISPDEKVCRFYSVIKYAIENDRRIAYYGEYVRYDNEIHMPVVKKAYRTIFTPKCMYMCDGKPYLFGYNHTDRKIEAIAFEQLSDVQLALSKQNRCEDITLAVKEILKKADPKDYIQPEKREVIYEGPITFLCKAKLLEETYRHFGEPCARLEKDYRWRVTYPVKHATITADRLDWIAKVSAQGLRVIAPEEAVQTVKGYYNNVSRRISNKTFL